MSCYEWESGDWTLPASEWPSFRKNVIQYWNNQQLELHGLASEAYDKASELAKGKRGKNRESIILEAIATTCSCTIDEWGVSGTSRNIDKYYLICDLIFKNKKLSTPKKKDLNLLPVTKSACIESDEFNLTLSNDGRKVHWHVYENNRACDYVQDDPFVKFFFRQLSYVRWTRKTGGKLIGNDEYNRDSYEEGGGGNYVKRTWGPSNNQLPTYY